MALVYRPLALNKITELIRVTALFIDRSRGNVYVRVNSPFINTVDIILTNDLQSCCEVSKASQRCVSWVS